MGALLINVHSSGSHAPDSVGDLVEFCYRVQIQLSYRASDSAILLQILLSFSYHSSDNVHDTFVFCLKTLWLDFFFCVCDMFSVALFCSAVFCFFVLLKMVSLLVKLFLKPNIFVFFLAKLGRGSVPSCSPVCIISSKIGHFPFSTPGHTFYFDYRSRLHSLLQSKLFQQCVA